MSKEINIMHDTALMDTIDRVANVMASAKVTMPNHLKGNPADCWSICMQAAQWGMNPMAVAQKTHLVNGTMGYEAQLVNAVVTSMAPTKDRVNYNWFGDWDVFISGGCKGKEDGLGVNVYATMKGEDEPRVLKLLLSQASVRNSPLWKTDPRQQLAYLGVKRWARLHCPDVILGVYTPDEIETAPAPEKDITEQVSRVDSVKESLKPAPKPKPKPAPKPEPKAPTLKQIKTTLEVADNPEDLAFALEAVQEFLSVGDNGQYRDELAGIYQARKKELEK